MTLTRDITFYETCSACPEQYDVHFADTNEYIGYLRLRHGYFSVEDAYGTQLFGRSFPVSEDSEDLQPEEEEIMGYYADGIFDYEYRDIYLTIATRFLAESQSAQPGEFTIDYSLS